VLLAIVFEHPLILAALLCSVLVAAWRSGVLSAVLRVLSFSVPLAVGIATVNAIFVRDGVKVIFHSSQIPVLGRIDVTAEAALYGGILGLRTLVVIAAAALFSTVVCTDSLLRSARHLSTRSVLTISLALRMVPMLLRDGRRLFEVQRGRDHGRWWRFAVVRALMVGSLERALELAATLEVRGYGLSSGRGLQRGKNRRRVAPYSREDIAFLLSGLCLAVGGGVALVVGSVEITAYPTPLVPLGAVALSLTISLIVVASIPFAGRRTSA
jgi:energy-coupling factor transport system permease protein